MKEKIVVYWSRRDFRLDDNPALHEALEVVKNDKVKFLPMYILDENLLQEDRWNIGYPRRKFLAKTLSRFASKFNNFFIFIGQPQTVFNQLSAEYVVEIFINEDIEPYARKRDAIVHQVVTENKGKVNILPDQLTINRQTKSGSGSFYSVFTPFKNNVWQEFISAKAYPISNPKNSVIEYLKLPNTLLNQISETNPKHTQNTLNLVADNDIKVSELESKIFKLIDCKWILTYANGQYSLNLDDVFTRPNVEDVWYLTEGEVKQSFEFYVNNGIQNYHELRNLLGEKSAVPTTSRMSAALKWGLISPRTLMNMICSQFPNLDNLGVTTYISELIWREFYRYIMFHQPEVLTQEYQPKFREKIDWVTNDEARIRFEKWIRGETGYKLVDAAMNQIVLESWMHNRMRMVVASVLCKNLGVDWRWGQDYFRTVLVDLDEASNNGGWQWAASVGADPKPIRIFNPYTQAEKFDSTQAYQNTYIPKNYQIKAPVIEHKLARQEALKRYGLSK